MRESIWVQSCEIPPRGRLPGDMKTQAVVIGAGMAGLLTAFLLQERGIQTIVLEANRIGSGQTGNTTAKLTSQHGMIYSRLIRQFGKKKARQYAAANEAALEQFRDLLSRLNLNCDFEEQCSYVYGTNREALIQEAQAAAELGLPASFTSDLPLPFSVAGAVKLERQAQFHPLKFLRGLSKNLTIYEQTPVHTVSGHEVSTPYGTVWAKHIIFACHFPFLNFPGLYFSKLYQDRSYVLALRHANFPRGMWIGAEKGGYSFRTYGDLLLLGGAGHRAGENARGGRYDSLRTAAKAWFPHCEEVAHWSAQDCMPADGVPYIGPFSPRRPNWYVATGFQKWGMTTSMVAATLLCNLICHRPTPYAEVFSPARLNLPTLAGVAAQSGQGIKGVGKRLLGRAPLTAEEIPAGQGGIVSQDGRKIGIYRDLNGTVYPVDIRCPHLGCQPEWDPDERCWACPCHGSRFDCFGRLISGPAQEGIAHE